MAREESRELIHAQTGESTCIILQRTTNADCLPIAQWRNTTLTEVATSR